MTQYLKHILMVGVFMNLSFLLSVLITYTVLYFIVEYVSFVFVPSNGFTNVVKVSNLLVFDYVFCVVVVYVGSDLDYVVCVFSIFFQVENT